MMGMPGCIAAYLWTWQLLLLMSGWMFLGPVWIRLQPAGTVFCFLNQGYLPLLCPPPIASGSGSGLRVCLSPTGPPSAIVSLGQSSSCDIAPLTDRLDGQGDDAVRPGRNLHRTLKRPCRFESPVGWVTGDKGKKKKGNDINPRSSWDGSYAKKHFNNSDIASSSIIQSVDDAIFNHSEYANFSEMECVPIESDAMALHPVLPEAQNASILAAIQASGESDNMSQLQAIFLFVSRSS